MRTHTMTSLACWLLITSAAYGSGCGDDDSADGQTTAGSSGSGGTGGKVAGAGRDAQAGQRAQAGTSSPEDDAGAPQSDAPHVTLADGELAGSSEAGIQQFLGIPYAKPPIGELRFRRAQPNAAWSGVRAATTFGPRCAQNESTVLMNAASADEDCLYVNVWTPELTPQKPLPVMFWIHGGGNQNGSANEPVPYTNTGLFYTGQHLAKKQGVVVVTLNYRLGAFGFLTHPALDAEEGGTSGNQGLWDQNLALQWVKTHIAKFGGDPENVTIFGESAGSLDVCLHVASPKSKGLFAKAISQSGGCTTRNTLKSEAATQLTPVAAALGCTGDDVLGCLRKKSTAELLAQSSAGGGRFANIVDGELIPKQPRELFDSGDVAKVPYILGSNTDEGTLFTLGTPVSNETELRAALTKSLPNSDLDKVLEVYPLSQFADQKNPPQAALARILGDAQLVCSTWDAAARMAKLGGGVWMYNFDVPVTIAAMPDLGLGASHGAELVYVFQTSPTFAPENVSLSDTIQTYWANFAKTGDPNAGSLLAWPAFDEARSARINFALQPTIAEGFRKAECEFWRQGYEARFAALAQ